MCSPVLVYKMVHESLEVAETVSTELVQRVLALSVKQVVFYGFGRVYNM